MDRHGFWASRTSLPALEGSRTSDPAATQLLFALSRRNGLGHRPRTGRLGRGPAAELEKTMWQGIRGVGGLRRLLSTIHVLDTNRLAIPESPRMRHPACERDSPKTGILGGAGNPMGKALFAPSPSGCETSCRGSLTTSLACVSPPAVNGGLLAISASSSRLIASIKLESLGNSQ